MTAQSPDKTTELVSVTIDGVTVEVPKGTLMIRAAEHIGVHIPRFCDHPLLKPAGACRQCLVEVSAPDRDGNLRPMPKPQTSCTETVQDGMVIATQHTSGVADKAQQGIMEFLLINHPLDCPVCDKGGECPLQNQAMSNGRATSRFVDIKRTFPKPLKISSEILLDRDRCILCQRCTRFSDEIAGDPFIDLQGRGGGSPGREIGTTHSQQIGGFDANILDFTYDGGPPPAHPDRSLSGPKEETGLAAGFAVGPVTPGELDTSGRPFSSYFSGNTIQICPVGALTSATYRFRSRPFDLVSTESVAEHDASGSAIRIDHRRGQVLRRLAGDDPEVNEEWITDKDRFAFTWQSAPDRLDLPLVRDEETGELEVTSWLEAFHLAAEGLTRAMNNGGVGVLPGGRLPLEDAFAWSRFARTVLQTNDIDHRMRHSSAEEADFLTRRVAAAGLDVTYTDLEHAPHVLLVGLEPEEECGTVFLRLRKGMLAGRVSVTTIAPMATRGATKLRATVLPTVPGGEADVLQRIDTSSGDAAMAQLAEALAQPGAVILVGERAGAFPGALSAAEALAARSGARLAWIPRRAGERAAVEAGLLPGLLPGGRRVDDAASRADLAALWSMSHLPSTPGRDLAGMVTALRDKELSGLLIGGVDPADAPDPQLVREALAAADFVVQLEVRRSEVTEHADVVLPVAPPVEKGGTFINWEGRHRPFGQVLASRALADRTVLDGLAREMGVELGTATLTEVHDQISQLADWRPQAADPAAEVTPAATAEPGAGQAVLATWKMMIDDGRCLDGEPHLAGTAHRPVVRMSSATAAAIGAAEGTAVTVRGPRGTITLPLAMTTMTDGVVWLPQHSPGSHVNDMLGVAAGALVDLEVAR